MMTSLSPEDWVKLLSFSGILTLMILVLAISIYFVREFLIRAADRDREDIRKKVKLMEFYLRSFRHHEE